MLARIWPLAPALLVALGAVIVAFGGFWAAFRQSHFNAELRSKNAEIARLQVEGANAITGGDSFCYVGFQVYNTSGQIINVNATPDDLMIVPNFIHKGKYPLYDVTARFVEVDAIPVTPEKLMGTTIPVGNLTPGFATTTAARFMHHGKDINYNVFFVGRNGSWIQTLRMKWVGNGWATADRVAGLSEGKELLREVTSNYPLNERGDVDWNPTPKPQQPRTDGTH